MRAVPIDDALSRVVCLNVATIAINSSISPPNALNAAPPRLAASIKSEDSTANCLDTALSFSKIVPVSLIDTPNCLLKAKIPSVACVIPSNVGSNGTLAKSSNALRMSISAVKAPACAKILAASAISPAATPVSVDNSIMTSRISANLSVVGLNT